MDYDTLLHDFIITLPATLASIGALIGAWRNARKIDHNTKITETKADELGRKVEVVHRLTNGNTKVAIETAKKLAYETGRKEGIRSVSDHHRRQSDRKVAKQ